MSKIINGIKFFTVKETAELLQISEQTVWAYLRKGMLRGQRIGSPVYVTEMSIQEFLRPSLGDTPVNM